MKIKQGDFPPILYLANTSNKTSPFATAISTLIPSLNGLYCKSLFSPGQGGRIVKHNKSLQSIK